MRKRIIKKLLEQIPKGRRKYIKQQLEVLGDDAFKGVKDIRLDETLEDLGSYNPVTERIRLHHRALTKETDAPWLVRDFPTLQHEFGHATMAGVDPGEMRHLVSGSRMTQYLEDRADEFAMVAAARAGISTRGTMKMTPQKRQKIFKYLLGAGAGGAIMAEDDELLAMRGAFTKGAKSLVGQASSAAKALRGAELQPGKVVKDVIKGKGSWRKILFEDDTFMTVTKEDVNALCRGVGTKRYIRSFEQKAPEDRTVQALKSMRYHEVRMPAFGTREMARRHHGDYLKALQEMGEELPPDTVFVVRGNKYFQMPKEYAQHLEELGVLNIVRGKQEQKLLKPYKRNK